MAAEAATLFLEVGFSAGPLAFARISVQETTTENIRTVDLEELVKAFVKKDERKSDEPSSREALTGLISEHFLGFDSDAERTAERRRLFFSAKVDVNIALEDLGLSQLRRLIFAMVKKEEAAA